jgi:hypothetical protein
MASKKIDPIIDVATLLKKLVILHMFELGVAQGTIAKKLKVDVHLVNDFLKGIKETNGKKRK